MLREAEGPNLGIGPAQPLSREAAVLRVQGFTGCTVVQEDFKMTAGGAWRRPRMKVYDYNQEFGGNYYQVSQIFLSRGLHNIQRI